MELTRLKKREADSYLTGSVRFDWGDLTGAKS